LGRMSAYLSLLWHMRRKGPFGAVITRLLRTYANLNLRQDKRFRDHMADL
jgi:hypothetical protein